MVIRSEQMQSEQRENMRGGQGAVSLLGLVPAENLPKNARLFSLITLEKGCGIGSHAHEAETEVYYVLEGEGILDDSGTQKTLRAGDCNVCGGGGTHAIANEKDEPLRFVAVIIRDS